MLVGHLSATDFEHTVAEVDTHYLLGLDGAAQLNGEVASAGSHVEQTLGLLLSHEAHSSASPPLVDAHGHAAVHKVVGGCNRVEHLSHLTCFTLGVVVRVDFLGLILHNEN